MSTPDFEVGVNNDNCKHANICSDDISPRPNLPTHLRLVTCHDCGQYFVVKQVHIIAASNGGTKGLCNLFFPSNFLGFICGGEFDRPC